MIALLLTFILTLSSCATASYQSSKAVGKAQIELPSHVESVLIMDRSLDPNGVQDVFVSGKVTSAMLGWDRLRLMKAVSKAIPVLADVSSDTETAEDVTRSRPQLSLAEIKSRAKDYDALLCLDQFWEMDETKMTVFPKHQLDANGNDYVIDAMRGEKQVRLKVLWRLYDTTTGKLLNEIPQLREEFYTAEGLDATQVNTKIASQKPATIEQFRIDMAKSMKRELSPRYHKSFWTYYRKGDRPIKRSATCIRNGDFKRAIAQLEGKQETVKNQKQRSRLEHNLALATFLSGMHQEGIKIASHAKNKYGGRKLSKLLQKMQNYAQR